MAGRPHSAKVFTFFVEHAQDSVPGSDEVHGRPHDTSQDRGQFELAVDPVNDLEVSLQVALCTRQGVQPLAYTIQVSAERQVEQ